MKRLINLTLFALLFLVKPAIANDSLESAKQSFEETAKLIKQEIEAQPAKAMTWLEQFQAWLEDIQTKGKASLEDIKSKKEEFKAAAKKTEKFIEEETEFLEEASKEISAEIDDILD